MRKLPAVVLLLVLSVVSAHESIAQNRVRLRLEVQAHFGGALLGLVDRAGAGSSVEQVKLRKWLPGISTGIHLSKRWFVGLSMFRRAKLSRRDQFGFTGSIDSIARPNTKSVRRRVSSFA